MKFMHIIWQVIAMICVSRLAFLQSFGIHLSIAAIAGHQCILDPNSIATIPAFRLHYPLP